MQRILSYADVRSWVVLTALLAASLLRADDAPPPPIDLGANNADLHGINYASAAVTHPDGALESFYRIAAGGKIAIFATRSTDHGHTWSEPRALVDLPPGNWGGPIPLLDRDNELHFVIPHVRGEGRRPAVDRFIDLYHLRSSNERTQWSEPQRIFEGYVGSIQCLAQLKNGRILAPFAAWIGGRPSAPPTGSNVTTVVYSDDGGRTWVRSSAALTAPCYDGYNGSNYGACEPAIVELDDGRVWMLIRTQTGVLYESFSHDGAQWSEAQPSRFASSNSPAFLIRLADGRMVVFWNNCQPPPRVGGQGVYGGRDALHAAISDDGGQSWRGFREVYRDPTRHRSPPKRGDRGTAYPHATLTGDGKILLVSGQGAELRRRFLIDPDWLLETEADATFASVDAWHLFKGFGPAQRFWRDRTQGAQRTVHPDHPDRHVLRIARPDEGDADGAVWNFPAGGQGRLTMRLRREPKSAGAQISLADRFFDPCDDAGEQQSIFAVTISADGRMADKGRLESGRWYDLELQWTAPGACAIYLDGEPAGAVKARGPAPNGVSYLRIRSLAETVNPAGLLVESVQVHVSPVPRE